MNASISYLPQLFFYSIYEHLEIQANSEGNCHETEFAYPNLWIRNNACWIVKDIIKLKVYNRQADWKMFVQSTSIV